MRTAGGDQELPEGLIPDGIWRRFLSVKQDTSPPTDSGDKRDPPCSGSPQPCLGEISPDPQERSEVTGGAVPGPREEVGIRH